MKPSPPDVLAPIADDFEQELGSDVTPDAWSANGPHESNAEEVGTPSVTRPGSSIANRSYHQSKRFEYSPFYWKYIGQKHTRKTPNWYHSNNCAILGWYSLCIVLSGTGV